MKRVLIVSELFYPQNEIGALRPTKIFELLSKRGYIVDVITKSYSAEDSTNSKGRIWRIDATKPTNPKSTLITAKKVGTQNKFVLELKHIKRTWMSIISARDYYKKVVRFIRERNQCMKDYSTVFTTYGPISSILIGIKKKKKYPDINWICDFRDPMVVEECPMLFKPMMTFLQRKACIHADHIVAVSYGYLKRICGNRFESKRHMIPNGYDMTDLVDVNQCVQPRDVLHISYVGSMYEGKRRLTPLFYALRELIYSNKIDINRISFDYAGLDSVFVLEQAEEYGLTSIVKIFGHLSRSECLKLQCTSHLLVLATWNNRGEEGVFPGKFLEYMLIGHPIISLTDGCLPNSEITSVIREGHFGIAYESIMDDTDKDQLMDYLKNVYFEWLQTGRITYEPLHNVLDRYNYDNIILKIEELIG